jgi:hypothetical protein
MNALRFVPALLLFLVLTPTQTRAANRPVDGVKVDYKLITSPEILANVRAAVGVFAKKPRLVGPNEPPALWLEVETEFDAYQEFPELTFKYSLILTGKQGTPPKLVEGEVVHVDVAPGRERHSVMYIAPKTLNRFSENKAFNVNNIHGIYVEISTGGQLIAFGQKSMKLAYDKFAAARESITDKVNDAFLNKSQTPFAPLFFDYYEAIKPVAR